LDRYIKTDVDIQQIIAYLVAFGENIGLLKMAEISDISYQSMLTTARNFIYLENLKRAMILSQTHWQNFPFSNISILKRKPFMAQ
jgi:hypothetical protein